MSDTAVLVLSSRDGLPRAVPRRIIQMKYIYGYFLVATMPLWAQTSPTINSLPSREFGQPKLLTTLNSVAPNLVEGRELSGPTSLAFDTNAKPPILYVVDSLNNRVLAWRNSSAIGVCGTSAP